MSNIIVQSSFNSPATCSCQNHGTEACALPDRRCRLWHGECSSDRTFRRTIWLPVVPKRTLGRLPRRVSPTVLVLLSREPDCGLLTPTSSSLVSLWGCWSQGRFRTEWWCTVGRPRQRLCYLDLKLQRNFSGFAFGFCKMTTRDKNLSRCIKRIIYYTVM